MAAHLALFRASETKILAGTKFEAESQSVAHWLSASTAQAVYGRFLTEGRIYIAAMAPRDEDVTKNAAPG